MSSSVVASYVKQRKPMTRARREARRAYQIGVPILTYMAIWGLIPLFYGMYLGFTEYNGLSSAPKFIGFQNYIDFFTTGEYLTLLWRQFWIGVVCLSANIVLSFIVGLSLNVNSRIRGFFRTSVYVPSIAAVSITTAVFVSLLDPASGALNKMLVALGGEKVIWHYSQFWMVFWIMIFYLWRSLGPAAIIWLGGLQSIDPALYEAAAVDGANFIQRIRYITIPGLRFVAAYIILTGIIGVMQMFDVVMFISKGNPYGKTDVLMYRLYRDGIVNFNLGMAGAEATILGLVTVLFALLYFKFVVMKENEQ